MTTDEVFLKFRYLNKFLSIPPAAINNSMVQLNVLFHLFLFDLLLKNVYTILKTELFHYIIPIFFLYFKKYL